MTNEEKRNIFNAINNVYNMDATTWQEVLAVLYNTVNGVKLDFDDLETRFGLLLPEEVRKMIQKLVDDGTLANIINGELFQDLDNSIRGIKNNINDFKFINYFSQLNIDASTATPVEIVDALPDYSICMLSIGEGNKGFYNNPYDYGTFIVYKINSTRSYMEFITIQGDKKYSAIRRKDATTNYVSSWNDNTVHTTKDRPLNDNAYINELKDIANSYLKKDYWRYSTDTCFRTDNFIVNGKRNIDCSTFVLLVLLGIHFNDSKYTNAYLTNTCRNEYNWTYNFTNKSLFYSYRMAEQFYKNGWEIEAFPDYSNLQIGDLIFYKRENPGREHMVAFRNIDHVAMYYGIVNGRHKVIEVWVDGDICRIQDLEDNRENRIVMFARVPMLYTRKQYTGLMSRYYSNGDTIKINSIDNIISNNLTLHVSTLNLCDYDSIKIASISNVNGNEIEANNRLITGFIPCHSSFGTYNNNTPEGFSLVFIGYYDRDKKFLGIDGTNSSKYYMKRVYKYGSDEVITDILLEKFKKSFMINFGGVLRPWVKGVSKEISIDLGINSGNLTYNGVTFNELSKEKSIELLDKITQLNNSGMLHIYSNQLNDITFIK